MKKLVLFAALALGVSAAKAQFSVSNLSINAAGAFTSYKGDLDKSTPGVQLNAGYNLTEKYGVSLGFTYGFPIKESEEGYSSETKFSTLTLSALYNLIGSSEDKFSLYSPVGASYVMASQKVSSEELSGTVKDNGLTLNLGLGANFKIGTPIIFAQGGIAIPTGSSSTNSREGSTENPNPIPFHSVINFGIKFPLGSN